MRVFAKVAESGGFTSAAVRLGMSASMVSQHVKELEERLSVRLLNRTTRKVSLTETGRAYYQRCIRLLADLEETEHAASDMHAAPRGELRVNSWPSFGVRHLALAVADFPTRQPAPRRMAVWGAPSYSAMPPKPRAPADLKDHNCMTMTGSALYRMWHLRGADGTPMDISPVGNLHSNISSVLETAALAGHGLACLPTYLCCEALRSGRLVTVLDDYMAPTYAIRALYPHNRHLSAKVRAFVDFLAARFTRE